MNRRRKVDLGEAAHEPRRRVLSSDQVKPDDLQRLLQSLAGLPAIERRLADIERDLAFRAGEDPNGGNPGKEDDDARPQRDPAWTCESCHKVLARYNPIEGELRVKNRGAVIYVNVGIGGKVTIVCPSCGAVNAADSDGKAPGTQDG